MTHLAVASWRHYAPDYEVKILNLKTYKAYVQGEEHVGLEDFQNIMVVFCDWLRVAVLARHGGVWMDATLLLTSPLQHMVNESASFSGVHLENRLEGFFLASAAPSELMKRWAREMIHIGQLAGSDFDQYLNDLKSRGIEPLNGSMRTCDWSYKSSLHSLAHLGLHLVARIVNSLIFVTNFYLHICNERYWMDYMRAMVAFYSVLGQYPANEGDLHMTDSLKTFNALTYSLGWSSSDSVQFMFTSRSQNFDLDAVHGIKLRRMERELGESWNSCEEGSVICRLQRSIGSHLFAEVPVEGPAIAPVEL
eukprot:Skav209982  [mRNA]  locus=scaffold1046:261732:262652:+ [translate_table: standard]